MTRLEFEYIDNENDSQYHRVYCMVNDIFPEMMPYWAYRTYKITVALNEKKECVAFMLLQMTDNHTDDMISSCGSDDSYSNSYSTHSFDNSAIDTNDYNNFPNSTNTFENNCIIDEHNNDTKILVIASLGVDEKYRRQGIAGAYIKWIKDMFPEYSINLNVSVKNFGAIELYKKHGFIISKTKKNYYHETTFEPYIGEGVDAHEMIYKKSNNSNNLPTMNKPAYKIADLTNFENLTI